MEELKEKYRVPFVLHYVEGYSVRELSEMLNVSEGSIKTRLYRSRNAFDNIACGFTDEGKELALTNQGYYEIDALKTINREWDEKQVKVSLQGFGYYTCDEAGNDTLSFDRRQLGAGASSERRV